MLMTVPVVRDNIKCWYNMMSSEHGYKLVLIGIVGFIGPLMPLSVH